MWNKGHPPYRGHSDLMWSGPFNSSDLILHFPCPFPKDPAMWASSIPQRHPFQKLCTYCSWYLKQYSQVLCMAGSILNFRSQLKCHLLSQIISEVPTILANPAVCYITLSLSSHILIIAYKHFMYLFVRLYCLYFLTDISFLRRQASSVWVGLSLAPGGIPGLTGTQEKRGCCHNPEIEPEQLQLIT